LNKTSTKYSKWEKTKKICYFVVILLSSGLYFALAYKGYKDQNVDLKTLKTYTGQISSFGETIRTSGKYRTKVFYVDIDGLEQRLGVYRMSRNYEPILNKLNTGDIITVYYKKQHPCDININLVQIEKNDTVLLAKEEYMKKESALIWIGLLAGIFSVLLSLWYLKRDVIILFKDND
jgi:hypothetical protein